MVCMLYFRLMSKNPQLRPSATEILQDPYIKSHLQVCVCSCVCECGYVYVCMSVSSVWSNSVHIFAYLCIYVPYYFIRIDAWA